MLLYFARRAWGWSVFDSVRFTLSELGQVAIVCAPASLTASVNFGGSLLSDSAENGGPSRGFPAWKILLHAFYLKNGFPVESWAMWAIVRPCLSEVTLCLHLFSSENGGFAGERFVLCPNVSRAAICHGLLGPMDHHGSPWMASLLVSTG